MIGRTNVVLHRHRCTSTPPSGCRQLRTRSQVSFESQSSAGPPLHQRHRLVTAPRCSRHTRHVRGNEFVEFVDTRMQSARTRGYAVRLQVGLPGGLYVGNASRAQGHTHSSGAAKHTTMLEGMVSNYLNLNAHFDYRIFPSHSGGGSQAP